jgi:hypothetical protein
LSLLLFQTGIGRTAPGGPPGEQIGTQGTTYYVALTGSDTYPGTEAWPWRTIQKAANTLVAGDTVYIRAGTYPERVVPQNSGSAGSTITYAAYPGETVTIDGSGITLPDDLAGLFDVSNKSYIRISGLRVVNAGPYANNAAILVNDSSHIVIENNYTYNTVSSGIGVWGSDHVTVAGNEVELANTDIWQECISLASTNIFEIRDNLVHNCQEEGICVKDGATNGQVYRNRIYDVHATGLYVDAWDKHTYNIEVFQNVVSDVSDNAFAVASETGGTLENVRIYNNIAYHNRYIGFSVSTNGVGGPMDGIAIINNTAYNNGWVDWGGGIAVDNPNAQNVVVRNNIVSQNLYFQITVAPGVPAQNYTIDHNLIDGYRDHEDEGETRGNDFVEGDPLFVNPSQADFHLQETSPAIDQGSANDAPADDYDGHSRPQDGDQDGTAGYDIGAYEVVAYSEHIYLPLVQKTY